MSSPASSSDVKLEIGHVLFIDIVGYSRLLINEQSEQMQKLREIVRGTEQFRAAEKEGKLLRLPTGDGGALVFRTSVEAPVLCALEISKELKKHPELRVRMGIHSGPVNEITDLNEQANIAGAGINVAQRVMDCGDAGHILLSRHIAEDLEQYRQWQPQLHDLGECEVKHGVRVSVVNLYTDNFGNSEVPDKFKRRDVGAAAKDASPKSAIPKWVMVGAVVAVVLIGLLFWSKRTPTISAAPEKSIAVLPFENLSEEKQNEYFTDGVQDEILSDLAKIADLKVISRTSVMQYKAGAQRNLREIAQQLGVAHVVEGSVQRAGNRVRVSAQLIDARTDTHLWVNRYDRPLDDVFAIQSEIAKAIAGQLQAKLSAKTKSAIEEPPTKDLAAHDLYVRAKLLMLTGFFDGEKLFEAAHLLDQAIARDPDFFLAYCLSAEAHSRLYWVFDHKPARRDLADRAVKAALHLWAEAGEGHLERARYLYMCNLDYDNARAELATARRKLPNNAQIFALLGHIDKLQGRWNESVRNYEEALELDPRNLFTLQQLSSCYLFMRRFAESAATVDHALALVPEDADLRVWRASVDLYWRADPKPLHEILETLFNENPAAAVKDGESALEIALYERDSTAAGRALPTAGFYRNALFFSPTLMEGCVARVFGDDAAARKAFTAARAEVELTVREQPDYGPPLCMLGLIDAGLGRKEQAIREGRRASELTPVTKDAINGAHIMQYLGLIYAWTGEKDLAIEQIAATLQVPSRLSYGELRLHPFWDPLRGDPRFEKIVQSLAPK